MEKPGSAMACKDVGGVLGFCIGRASKRKVCFIKGSLVLPSRPLPERKRNCFYQCRDPGFAYFSFIRQSPSTSA